MLVAMEVTTGLRERKKARTREAIVQAAFELFEERGFEGTTVADIADAAEIAPRTFFAYFPSKDDVVFHDFEEKFEELGRMLREREPGTNAFDALRAGIEDGMEPPEASHLREKRCRMRLVRESESLAAHDQFLRSKFAGRVADAVADDLGVPPDDVRPRMGAASMTAAIEILQDLPEQPDDLESTREILDALLSFLQGGLAALQDRDDRSAAAA
jgi:AcrR family transcriptional regulator